MSLINQMLRDLEERRQGERQLPTGSTLVVAGGTPRSRRTWMLLAGGVLLAVAIWGGLKLYPSQRNADIAVTHPVERQPAPVVVKPVVPAEPAVTVAVAPEPQPIVADPVVVESVISEAAVVAKPAPESQVVVAEPIVEKIAEPTSLSLGEVAPLVTEIVPVDEKRFQKKVANLPPVERAQNLYRQALALQQQGDADAAEASLAKALALNPQLLDARLQLIALLQQNKRSEEAYSQLDLGLQLHPASFQLRKIKARQLLQSGHLDESIAVLHTPPLPGMAEDLEYHALLAAILQESGGYQQAIVLYQNLLSYRPQETMWWLGLAISLDQTGSGEQAKSAYRKVVAQPGLRTDLAEYAQSRLQAL